MIYLREIAEIAGIITCIAAALTLVIGVLCKFGAFVEAFRCILRSNMLHTYYTNKETETVRQYELQNFELNYKAYKALRGNSFIDEIRKKVVTWEVIS